MLKDQYLTCLLLCSWSIISACTAASLRTVETSGQHPIHAFLMFQRYCGVVALHALIIDRLQLYNWHMYESKYSFFVCNVWSLRVRVIASALFKGRLHSHVCCNKIYSDRVFFPFRKILYICFIGDITPESTINRLLSYVLTLLGIALLSMCWNLLQMKLEVGGAVVALRFG